MGLALVSIDLMHYLLLTRFIRFFRFLSKQERYSIIFDVIYKLAPFFTELFAVIGMVYYVFTILGNVLFSHVCLSAIQGCISSVDDSERTSTYLTSKMEIPPTMSTTISTTL